MLHQLGSIAERNLQVVVVEVALMFQLSLRLLVVDFALMCHKQKLDFGFMSVDLEVVVEVVEACKWTCYVHSAYTYCILVPILPSSTDSCPAIHWHPCFFSFLVYRVAF